MSKRQQYKAKSLMLTSMTLVAMRETAFGNRAYFETKNIIESAARLRDDDGLLAAAEAKRQRKMAKRRGAA
jgi:hypothetical protein